MMMNELSVIDVLTLLQGQKPFCGWRRLSGSFVKVKMYQGRNLIEYHKKKLRYTKDILRCLQTYPKAREIKMLEMKFNEFNKKSTPCICYCHKIKCIAH